MTLTYWIAHCLTDSPAYSIRRKTKKEVQAALDQENIDKSSYSKPKKVVVEYESGFDLLTSCLGEGGLYEEEMNRSDADFERMGIDPETELKKFWKNENVDES